MDSTVSRAYKDDPVLYQEKLDLEEVPPAGQELLKGYAGLSEDELIPEIKRIRDAAFEFAPYPCIGRTRFLRDRWPAMPYFQDFLPALKKGANVLDVGCGFGQEVRCLDYFHGIDSSQLFACDLHQGLIDLGYDLFRDRARTKATFFQADILKKTPDSVFVKYKGAFDLIQVSQFFHVWDLEDMITAAKNVVAFSSGPGARIAGNQVGSRIAGRYDIVNNNASHHWHYRHSPESWQHFWKQVGDETGTEWESTYEEVYSQAVEERRSLRESANTIIMYTFCATRTR